MNNKWQTPVEIKQSPIKLDYSTPAFFIGSCFSDNISDKLFEHKFNVLNNPFGVLYNPYSIQTALRLIMNEIQFDDKDLVFNNNQWHSLLHHSTFSSADKNELKKSINTSIKNSSDFLRKTKFLFITLGTAWVYTYKATNRQVANCHKIPEKEFRRFRLSVCDITDEYSSLIEALIKFNHDLQIIFTVSPIRHLKDGAVENQLSKSTLNVVIHQLKEIFEDKVDYFPSYEIVMDELRDYRFYASDMIHIAPQAIEHIFESFTKTFLSNHTQQQMFRISKVVTAAKHKPFNKKDDL